MISILAALGGKIIEGVFGAVGKRQERKAAADSARAKLAAKKQDADLKIDLTDKEWEAAGKALEGGTWKDEYVTIIITAPIWLTLIAPFCSAEVQAAVHESVENLRALFAGSQAALGDIILGVTFAAVSIRVASGLRRP